MGQACDTGNLWASISCTNHGDLFFNLLCFCHATACLFFLLPLYIKDTTTDVWCHHVQSIKTFYTNKVSDKARICWEQSAGRVIMFWVQAITIPLKGHGHRCLAKYSPCGFVCAFLSWITTCMWRGTAAKVSQKTQRSHGKDTQSGQLHNRFSLVTKQVLLLHIPIPSLERYRHHSSCPSDVPPIITACDTA